LSRDASPVSSDDTLGGQKVSRDIEKPKTGGAKAELVKRMLSE